MIIFGITLKGVSMNDVTEILGEINDFLTTHTTDRDTTEFLVGLKRKLLELDMQVPSRKKTTTLPTVEVLLRSVGKRAFVDCYEVFKMAANGKIENIASSIKSCSGAESSNSLRTKASVGARIFREGLETEALKAILSARKVDDDTKKKAQNLLLKEDIK